LSLLLRFRRGAKKRHAQARLLRQSTNAPDSGLFEKGRPMGAMSNFHGGLNAKSALQ
jgi:hypothetical protein